MGKRHSNQELGPRQYAGHTGSPLDEPSKTLKAGVHGVPGGENMVVLADGSVRRFTVAEAARLQGFPEDVEFHGSNSEQMRQIGNAVPPMLTYALARQIRKALDGG
jgi:DNA (cytosine-5)-methyltransferase 1